MEIKHRLPGAHKISPKQATIHSILPPGFENFAQALAKILTSSDELPVEDTQKQKFKMVAEELLE